jgi:hypothetical protein
MTAIPTTPITLTVPDGAGDPYNITFEQGGTSPGLAPRQVSQVDGAAVSLVNGVYQPTVDVGLNAVVGTAEDPTYTVGAQTATLNALARAMANALLGTLNVQLTGTPGSVSVAPANGTGSQKAPVNIPAGGASTPVIAAGLVTRFVDISNIGTQPATLLINGQPARTLNPGGSYTREGSYVPGDAYTATSANGTTLSVAYA